MSEVTRFEVIDENGRAYSRLGVSARLVYQDDGRTLKVFVRSLPEDEVEAVKAEYRAGWARMTMP